jgi:hypothetical protein
MLENQAHFIEGLLGYRRPAERRTVRVSRVRHLGEHRTIRANEIRQRISQALSRSVISDDSVIWEFGQAWQLWDDEWTAMAESEQGASTRTAAPVRQHYHVGALKELRHFLVRDALKPKLDWPRGTLD